MRLLIKNTTFWISFALMFCIGIAWAYSTKNNFSESYLAVFSTAPIYYSVIILCFFGHYIIHTAFNRIEILVRSKSIYRLAIKIIMTEILLLIIMLFALSLGLIVSNFKSFTIELRGLLLLELNIILIMSIYYSIVRCCDIFVKNRALIVCLFLTFIFIADFLAEHFSFFNDSIIALFMNKLLLLPFNFTNYWIVFLILFILTTIINGIFIIFSVKGGYYLERKKN